MVAVFYRLNVIISVFLPNREKNAWHLAFRILSIHCKYLAPLNVVRFQSNV